MPEEHSAVTIIAMCFHFVRLRRGRQSSPLLSPRRFSLAGYLGTRRRTRPHGGISFGTPSSPSCNACRRLV